MIQIIALHLFQIKQDIMKSIKNFSTKEIKNAATITGGDKRKRKHDDDVSSDIITINIYESDGE
ncbi:MAG: hypothetical protein ACI8ZM_004871 [Crocinitomix sp.]|jgi:hypothetical protein